MKGFAISFRDDSLSDPMSAIESMIREATGRAIDVSDKLLGAMNFGQPVEIVFEENPSGTIKEDGIGGSTRNSGLIITSVDPTTVTANGIYTTVCHELAHAKRFSVLSEFDNRPIAAFVAEGLAVAFENEIRDRTAPETFFLRDIENRRDSSMLIEKVRADFLDANYNWEANYSSLFFDGDPERGLPRWAGYEIGYKLVGRHMSKTGKKASELIGEKPDAFL